MRGLSDLDRLTRMKIPMPSGVEYFSSKLRSNLAVPCVLSVFAVKCSRYDSTPKFS
jgi:hypothetical protein